MQFCVPQMFFGTDRARFFIIRAVLRSFSCPAGKQTRPLRHVVFTQSLRDFPGTLQHGGRHAGQPRNLDSIAFVRSARDDFPQKYNILPGFLYRNAVIVDSGQLALQFGQLVVMRREQRFGPDPFLAVDMFGHGPRNAESVKG